MRLFVLCKNKFDVGIGAWNRFPLGPHRPILRGVTQSMHNKTIGGCPLVPPVLRGFRPRRVHCPGPIQANVYRHHVLLLCFHNPWRHCSGDRPGSLLQPIKPRSPHCRGDPWCYIFGDPYLHGLGRLDSSWFHEQENEVQQEATGRVVLCPFLGGFSDVFPCHLVMIIQNLVKSDFVFLYTSAKLHKTNKFDGKVGFVSYGNNLRG